MLTEQELAAALAEWRARVLWRLIDRDRAYGAQCWDLAADWAEVCGCPLADFWTLYDEASPEHTLVSSMWLYWPVRPGITAHFTRHGRHEEIRAGDIPIWARSPHFPGSHIAVATGPAGPTGIPCMTQNPGAAQHAVLTTAGLLGFLRPITTPTPTPTPEEDDMTTLYARATANSDPTRKGDPGSSRIWASPDKGRGTREIGGVTYSGVWEVKDGVPRRLSVWEWELVQLAYAAAGRAVPLADVHGNTIERLYYGPEAVKR